MSIMWNITNGENGSSISVIFSDGHGETIRDSHAAFNLILEKLKSTEPSDTPEVVEAFVRENVNVINAIGGKLTKLSDRITTDGFRVYFDNDPIELSIAKYIIESFKRDLMVGISDPLAGNGTHWSALVQFLEKLYQNSSKTAIRGLYQFLNKYGLTILPNGDFMAYKGLNKDYTSRHSGFGIVDGVSMTGNLPNNVGSVIEFPRSDVVEDGSIGCAKGLHAGSVEYARGFSAGKVMAVSINPRDVVSVPTDCADQKIRTCRYVIMFELPHDFTQSDRSSINVNDVKPDYEYEDETECDYCESEYCTGECESDSECCHDSEDDSDNDYTWSPNPVATPPVAEAKKISSDYTWRP